MEEKSLSEISAKLDVLVKLAAANAVKNLSFKEQVRLLSSVGLKPSDIAHILGKTSNNVRVTLALMKKGGQKYGFK